MTNWISNNKLMTAALVAVAILAGVTIINHPTDSFLAERARFDNGQPVIDSEWLTEWQQVIGRQTLGGSVDVVTFTHWTDGKPNDFDRLTAHLASDVQLVDRYPVLVKSHWVEQRMSHVPDMRLAGWMYTIEYQYGEALEEALVISETGALL